ncbi:MAG: patatin-like phospholipase family protein [Mucilaginibacter sp.]
MAAKKDEPKFYLGICMAGAVSAGAYTAGVMDYLLEALEAYEKKRGTGGYPSHRIEIPVIGGASAGGMTSIITAAALQQGITPVKEPGADLMAERPENMLYHSWVDLTDEDMFAKMLDTGDIKDAEVESAFNCMFIDEVAKRTITPAKSAAINWQTRPEYISPDMKLFTTLSNLQGFNYDVLFNSANTSVPKRPYYMALHNDYACFQLNWKKGARTPAGWMPLNIEHGESAKEAMQSAMATGAFPVGLKAREVTRPAKTVNNDDLFTPNVLKAIQIDEDPYTTLNIDGGMINNEPFDKVRQILKDVSGQQESADYENYKKFKSTIIMVAPFPSNKPSIINKSAKLLNVIGLTLSAMISQMRSRPWQIDDALADGCAGQFLIDPARKFIKPDGDPISIDGERAIACGALGGFSGFLNKNFRVHDYFLGRHNCKIFLRDYFTIPDDAKNANPIFREGYKDITGDKYRSTVPGDGGWQIIPIVDDDVDYTFPKLFKPYDKNWPVQPPEAIDKYEAAMAKRVQAVILNIVKFKPMVKFALRIGVLLLRGSMARTVLGTIKKELKTWHLMH